MSYIKDELGLINVLVKSKDVKNIDKDLLNRGIEYFSLVIKEKNILAKREKLEKLVLSLTELVDDKLMELEFKRVSVSNEEEREKIDEVILELENLKKTIIDNNKIYIETILANLDSIMDGEKLLNECARIISYSANSKVDPKVFTSKNVNEVFNDIFEKVDILSFVERRENEEKRLEDTQDEKDKLYHLLSLSLDNFEIIEEFIKVLLSQMKLKEEKDKLLKELSLVDIELNKLEKSMFKTHRVQSRIDFLHSKIRRINEHILEKNEENTSINEYINTLHKTLKIIGLGEVTHMIRYSNKTYDNNLNEIVSPLYDLRIEEKENIFVIESVLDIALLLIEQVNSNIKNNLMGDTSFISIVSGINKKNSDLETEVNLELSSLEHELLKSVMKYLNNITISDGKLVIDGNEEISITSSAIATLLLKVIIDINGDVLLEDLPEYIKIKSNMQEIEEWYKDYISDMYDDTVESIKGITGQEYTLNKQYNK